MKMSKIVSMGGLPQRQTIFFWQGIHKLPERWENGISFLLRFHTDTVNIVDSNMLFHE